jgi:hypothetical protein
MSSQFVTGRTKTPRRASRPSSSVRSVSTMRAELGDHVVAPRDE